MSSLISLLSFADLGLSNGLLNSVSKANGTKDNGLARKSVSSAFFMLVFIALILSLVYSVVSPFIEWRNVFNVKTELAIQESGPAMNLLMFIFLVSIPFSVVQKIQMGYQEGYVSELWQGAGSVIGLIGIIIAIYFQAGLPWLVVMMAGGPLLATLVNGWMIFTRNYKWIVPRWSEFDFDVAKNLLSVGLVFFVLQIFTLIGNSADHFVIAQIMGAVAVAEYAVVKKMFMTVMITQVFLTPLWPAFGESMAKQDYVWAKRALSQALKFSILIGGVLAIPLFVFGKEIIEWWVGQSLVPSSLLLAAFSLWIFQVNYGGTMSTFLNSNSLVRKQTVFIGLAAIVSVISQIIFVYYYGVVGAVMGVLVGYGVFYVVPAHSLAFGTLNKNLKRQKNEGTIKEK